MSLIDLTITPRTTDVGGTPVRRVLPFMKRRMVGPFIFLDHMGPAHFEAGHGIDVAPHPHIGLSTVTYLFEGEIVHRDSIGSEQRITPGALNWMTAGRGIAHSERTDAAERAHAHGAHGLQSWVALPKEYEDMAPEFHHHAAEDLPSFRQGDAAVTLVAGSAYGYESPAKAYSPLFYAEVKMPAGASLEIPAEYAERALYLIDGGLKIGGTDITARTLPVFGKGEKIVIEAQAPSHLMLLGGDPFAEPRYIDWNFVATSRERLEQAKDDWRNGRFPKIPGDDREFIPLPVYP